MKRSLLDVSDFTEELIAFAKERGFTIKTDKDGVALWPTYDNQTGGLGRWIALYITPSEDSNGVPEEAGSTEGTSGSN